MNVERITKSASVVFHLFRARPGEGGSREHVEEVPQQLRKLRIPRDAWGFQLLLAYIVLRVQGGNVVTEEACLESPFIYYGGSRYDAARIKQQLRHTGLRRTRRDKLAAVLLKITRIQQVTMRIENLRGKRDGAPQGELFAVEISPGEFKTAGSNELWLPATPGRVVDLEQLLASGRIRFSQLC